MTIQLGPVALQYDGFQISGPRSRQLMHLAMVRLRARQQRIDKQSVIAIIIRRWLIAPTLTGIMLGMLMQQ